MVIDEKVIDLSNGKFKNQTITLGKKVNGQIINEADVRFINYDGESIDRKASGNDIIITVSSGNTVLGKVTIKNGAKKEYLEAGYEAWMQIDNQEWDNLHTYQYSLGDSSAIKSQTLKGTALNENIYGGYKDDKMYSGGGADTFVIYKGGAQGKTGDIIYGTDGDDTLELRDFSGQTFDDYTLYKEGDNLRLSSEGDNGVVDNITIDKYFTNPEGDRIYIPNFDNYVDNYYIMGVGNEKKANTLNGTEYDDKIIGGNKNDKITTGSDLYEDVIDGGKGNDTITINGLGEKNIYVNKGGGTDTIDIDLSQPMIERGSSTEPTIPYSPAVYQTDGDLEVDLTIGAEDMSSSPDSSDIYLTYTKRGADLIIDAEHYSDGTKESVTVKNYFSLTSFAKPSIALEAEEMALKGESKKKIALTPTNYDLSVNGEDVISEELPNRTITIAGVKVTELIEQIKKELPSYINDTVDGVLKKIKIPSGLANANVFLGTEFDDRFTGSKNKDVMLSLGGDNYFETGTKGQTVIASLGGIYGYNNNDDDYYSVSSFDSGTAIIDADGRYTLDILNVDTNDIHFVGSNMGMGVALEAAPVEALEFKGTTSASTTTTTAIQILTDSKGIKNIENIDFGSIYEKVMEVRDAFKGGSSYRASSTEDEIVTKEQAKAINSALTMADGLIDKFRGVAVIARKEVPDYDSIMVKDAKAKVTSVYDTIWVKDKKDPDVWQRITPETQEAAGYMMSRSFSAFASNLGNKFHISPSSLMQLLMNPESITFSEDEINSRLNYGDIDNAFKNKYYEKVKGTSNYIFSKTAIKEIKSSLFGVFENSYVGTDHDNSFTISGSDTGAAIASGTGNDTFTFKGEIGTKYQYDKPSAYNPYNPAEYNIVSSLESGEHDTIVFKNYTFGKDLYTRSLYDDYDKKSISIASDDSMLTIDNGDHVVLGAGFAVSKWDSKSDTYARVNYYLGEDGGRGYDFTNGKFAMTVKDKSKTYEVTAEHRSSDSLVYNWTGDKTNHVAYTYSDMTVINSGKGTNTIYANNANSEELFLLKKGSAPQLNYTYGGGTDIVVSSDYSEDIYNVNLTSKTNLAVKDWGYKDYDRLILDNDSKSASKIRMYFNVRNYSLIKGTDEKYISLNNHDVTLVSGNLSKSSFNIESSGMLKSSSKHVDGLNNGIEFNYNYDNDYESGVEDVYINNGSSYVHMDAMMNSIQSEVSGWLGDHSNYYSTDDVIANGKASEVKELLAIYNKYDLASYSSNTELVVA